ncbi:hypothetical protein ACUND9_11250 [Serratia sp. IR-2025]|uniref:hypothetical protein n=1 Tax=Serratia TaxID=613 RepID=UPI0034E1A4AF
MTSTNMPFKKNDPTRFFLFLINHGHTSKIESFNSYLTEMENKFHKDINKLGESYKSYIETLSPNENTYDIDDDFAEQHSEITHKVNNIFRRSFIVSLHSYLESTLEEIIRILNTKKGTTLQKKPRHKSTLQHYKETLENEFSVSFLSIKNEWAFMIDENTIRNNIVHNNGKPSNQTHKVVNKNPEISIKDGELIITKSYLTNLLLNIDKILLHVIKEI